MGVDHEKSARASESSLVGDGERHETMFNVCIVLHITMTTVQDVLETHDVLSPRTHTHTHTHTHMQCTHTQY